MSERRPVWLLDTNRPAYEALSGSTVADVVVVGAGFTGLTTALLMAREGLEVVVVEAETIGSGTTGGTTGKITSQHGVQYADMIERHGEEAARAYGAANQNAVETVAALVDELGADCGFTRASALVFAVDDDQMARLEREHEAASRLGLPSRLGEAAELPFSVAGALEFTNQAHLHPVRYCDALGRELARLGARVYEHTRIRHLEEAEDRVRVSTGDGGVVAAGHAVITTLLPFVDRGGFFAKTRPERAYGVAARLTTAPPEGMYIGAGAPVRSFRPWLDGGETGIIFVGESHETGSAEARPERWGELERFANERFPVKSFDYRWSAQDYHTADGIPYVGRSPLTDRTLVATGFKKWGLSNGAAAARILTDLVLGVASPHADVFDAGRIGDASAVGKMIVENVDVARHFLSDRVEMLSASSLAELAPGSGGVVETSDGRKVAAYRTPGGEVRAVSPTCTHLGCTVHWNDAENTWDCPCHGSRFDIDGEVITGPATDPLERVAEAD